MNRQIKILIFFILFRGFCIFAEDQIYSDYNYSDQYVIYSETVFDYDKSDAMSSFAEAFLRLKEKSSFDDETESLLLETLSKDANANEALNMLWLSWTGSNREKEGVAKLKPIFNKNPDCVEISLILALMQIRTKDFDSAEHTLEKTAELNIEKISQNKRVHSKFPILVKTLLSLYIKNTEWEKGDSLLEEIRGKQDFDDNLMTICAADEFYKEAAEKSDDTSFLIIFEGDKQKYQRLYGKYSALLKNFLSKSPLNNSELSVLLAHYKKQKSWNRLIEILLIQLSYMPNNTEILKELASAYSNAENYAAAYKIWLKIISSGGKIPAIIYFNAGMSAMKIEDYESAVKHFQNFLYMNPGNFRAIWQLVLVYMRMLEYDKAVAELNNLKKKMNKKGQYFPRIEQLLANIFSRQEKYGKALEILIKCEEYCRKNNLLKTLDNEFYLFYAYMAEKNKKYELLERILKGIIEKEPDNAEANNFLGYTYADRNIKLNTAEKLIKKALKLDPQNSAILDSMAWIYYRQKKYKKAKEYINKSIQAEKDDNIDSVILDHAGDIYIKLGLKEKALDFWNRALKNYSPDINIKNIEKKIEKYRLLKI